MADKADLSSAKLLENVDNSGTKEEAPLSKARQLSMLFTILVLMLLSLAVDTMIYPFFPITATDKGLSNAQLGLVFSAFDFSKFLSSPLFGSLVVKWHPKSMCGIGNLVTAIACAAFGFADKAKNSGLFLGLCIIIRLLGGIGSAMMNVAATSILMKSTSYEASTIAGIIEMTIGLGYGFGPAIGAFLVEVMGYTASFCLLSGLMIAFIPVYIAVVPNVVEKSAKEAKGFASLLSIPGCLLIFVHATVLNLNGVARAAGISEFMITAFHTSVPIIGLLSGSWGIIYILSAAVVTRIIDKRYTFHIMLTGWSITAIFVLLIGPSPLLDFIFHGKQYFWLTAVSMAGSRVMLPFQFVPCFQAALDQAEVNGYERDSLHTYGMIAGLINSGFALGNTVGPVIAGAITDALDFTWTLTYLDATYIMMITLMSTFLCYMKCTGRQLYVTSDSHIEEVVGESKEKSMDQLISDACEDRMHKCLTDSQQLTTVHQQQPSIKDYDSSAVLYQ